MITKLTQKNPIMMLNHKNYNSQKHQFHLVTNSPWPMLTAFSAFFIVGGFALYMHSYAMGWNIFRLGFLLVLASVFGWWRDVVREGTYEGQHTTKVEIGLRWGMLLFIVSEIMFFFAFFWAFFHSALVPVYNIGGVWPPMFLETLNPWGVPLFNTVLLLSSGATITWAHYTIILGQRHEAIKALASTIGLAVIFTLLQAVEYNTAPFNISDGIYGSVFYMATGFHGFHVIIGTSFLIVCLVRLINFEFSTRHHFGFEAAAWYWHFVDVVWIFLFITLYWWGS